MNLTCELENSRKPVVDKVVRHGAYRHSHSRRDGLFRHDNPSGDNALSVSLCVAVICAENEVDHGIVDLYSNESRAKRIWNWNWFGKRYGLRLLAASHDKLIPPAVIRQEGRYTKVPRCEKTEPLQLSSLTRNHQSDGCWCGRCGIG